MGRPNVVQVNLPPEVLAALHREAAEIGIRPATLAAAVLIKRFAQPPKKETKPHGQ